MVKTFRVKLTVFYTGAVLLMFLVFSTVLYMQFKKDLLANVDSELLVTAKVTVETGANPKELAENAEIIRKYGNEYYQIINRNGEVMMTSLAKNTQWHLSTKLISDAFRGVSAYDTIQYRGANFRTLYFPVNEDNILRIGESLESADKEIARLQKLLLFFFPFIAAASALMSWFLAGKSLDPVVKIRSLAEQIRIGKLGERINIGVKGREIDDLVAILNDMLESIRDSVETQKRFTSDVSHEIRSPLTSLRGNIEVALRKKRNAEEYEEVLRSSLADIVRVSRITDNLLFLTRADNKMLDLRKQRFDLRHMIERTVDHIRDKALSAGVSIVEKYTDDLVMNGDIDLLEQAFSNLLENAVKYTPSGGKVTIATSGEDESVTVSVGDTGVGIPEEDIPHLFERFYRVEKGGRAGRISGTGLGLSIAQWIISAHEGIILVKSAVGRGSDFIVQFPKTDI